MPSFTQAFCMSITSNAVFAGSSRSNACSLPPRRFLMRATMSGDSSTLCILLMDTLVVCVRRVASRARSCQIPRSATGNETMQHLRIRAALVLFAIIACLGVTSASAQGTWPTRPITMVVPFGAGGALDLVARVVADGLRSELGQPVIVDNRPGASGLIAMRYVAGAAPDGYTIILSSESNH